MSRIVHRLYGRDRECQIDGVAVRPCLIEGDHPKSSVSSNAERGLDGRVIAIGPADQASQRLDVRRIERCQQALRR